MDTSLLVSFEQWLAEESGALAIPMTVMERSPGSIRLNFVGISGAIEVIVLNDEVAVIVDHQGECWDVLADFTCAPVLVPGGVACGFCDPLDRLTYPTPRALLSEQIFQPFVDWIASELMPAEMLGLGSSSDGGSTWAVLLSATDRRRFSVTIPLRDAFGAALLHA